MGAGFLRQPAPVEKLSLIHYFDVIHQDINFRIKGFGILSAGCKTLILINPYHVEIFRGFCVFRSYWFLVAALPR